jgi:hypothetical protein
LFEELPVAANKQPLRKVSSDSVGTLPLQFAHAVRSLVGLAVIVVGVM